MANYTGHILLPESGWSHNWSHNWGGAYFSVLWDESGAISGRSGDINSRIYVRPSWDHHWDLNWGGNVNLHDGWNVNWDMTWGGNYPGGHFKPKNEAHNVLSDPDLSGTYNNNRPISLRGFNHTGYLAGGHADVFYNRILVEPILLDFGNVLSEQTLQFLVWNAFLEPKSLDAVNEIDLDSGTEFSGETTPRSYYPLEEENYSVTVVVAGPPQIEASLVLDWESPIGDITVDITGSRIVLLPVNFRSGVIESLVWRTDVLNSYNGTEQRVRSRLSPRQQLAIRAYLNRDEMHRVENLVYGWRKREWGVPMWIEARKVSSAVTSGDTTVNVDTQYGDFRVERLAVIWENPRKFDVFQIYSFDASSITLDRGVNDDYSADAYVMPVRSARMLRDPIRSASGYDSILETVLEVTDNTTLATSPTATQFNSEDTYFIEPLAPGPDGVNDTYQHRIDSIDSGSGVVEWDAPWDNIRINREFELILEGAQEIWEHREWLHRRAGRLRPFYMPTFENNFKLLSEGNVADSFEAEANDYSRQATARNHLAFKMADGTYELRTVTGATINVSQNLEIQFSPNLDVDASEIDEINFIGLKRLASDRIEMEWRPNNVAITNIPITEIEP
jgi:hypothetical protein